MSRSSGCSRASGTISGSAEVTTYWQNEWVSGVDRVEAQGSGSPAMPGKTCRSGCTSETSATGAPTQRRTRSARASICASATAVRPDRARERMRAGSLSSAQRASSAVGSSDPAFTA